ncbi:MAG: OmpA family protein, partial [Mariprofundus sp.]
LQKTTDTLTEARQTASSFKTRFKALLKLRTSANAIAQIISSSAEEVSELSPLQIISSADKELSQAITTHEQGDLNNMQKHAATAEALYQQLLDKALPWLTEQTASAVGKAANAGAKKYAPQIYQASKDKLAELRAFIDGISTTAPAQPELGLYLAREAKHMTAKVKAWRKKTGAHEDIVLQGREFKLKLADELGLSGATTVLLGSIDGDDLLSAVKELNKQLLNERKLHKQDMTRLKKQHEQDLQNKLVARSDELKQAQQSQMSDIKEAFKAKLARETFEKKRQQRLRALFGQGEVEILVNLDGSLLIRLTTLQFAPARSKIDSKYFDMLSRLKEAMDIYQERNLRIEGHTDNYGDVKPNQALSLKRAEAVRDFLTAAGADGARLKALGYGEVRPVASNDFPQGRAMNRRIDVVINAPE